MLWRLLMVSMVGMGCIDLLAMGDEEQKKAAAADQQELYSHKKEAVKEILPSEEQERAKKISSNIIEGLNKRKAVHGDEFCGDKFLKQRFVDFVTLLEQRDINRDCIWHAMLGIGVQEEGCNKPLSVTNVIGKEIEPVLRMGSPKLFNLIGASLRQAREAL